MGAIFGIAGQFDETRIERMAEALAFRSMSPARIIRFSEGFLGDFSPVDPGEIESVPLVMDGYAGRDDRGDRPDAETIFQQVVSDDPETFSVLQGQFTLGLRTEISQAVILFRDPSGARPLYYSNRDNRLVFASSPRAILASGNIEPVLNPVGISHYLSMITPPDPVTIFRDIHSLPPGHLLIWQDGHITIKPRCIPPWIDARAQSPGEDACADSLRNALTRAVSDAIPDNSENTGFFLSGGTDSGTVTGLAAVAGISPVQTFTIGYEGFGGGYEDYNEFEYARLIAKKFNTVHHEIKIAPDRVVRALPGIVTCLDQPSGDAINSYLVSSTLPDSITTVLTGTGGDEIFVGSHWFKHYYRLQETVRKWQNFPKFLTRTAENSSNILPGFIGRKLKIMESFREGPPAFYKHIKLVFSEQEKHRLFTGEMRDIIVSTESASVVSDYDMDQRHTDDLNRMIALLFKHEVQNLQLRDLDNMCHANAIEARSPLIDRRVLEVLAGTPGALKAPGQKLRHLMFKAFDDIIMMETRTRKKMSFIVPMDLWARRELKTPIQHLLSPDVTRKRGIFNPGAVADVAADFYDRNKERHPFKLWILAMLELWCRYHIDTPPGSSPPETLEDLL